MRSRRRFHGRAIRQLPFRQMEHDDSSPFATPDFAAAADAMPAGQLLPPTLRH
jgi:hypothetical protein